MHERLMQVGIMYVWHFNFYKDFAIFEIDLPLD